MDHLQTRLNAEIARRERLEHNLAEAMDTGRADAARARDAEAEAAVLRRELALLQPPPEDGDTASAAAAGAPTPPRLPAERVLYVGGRPGTVEQARGTLEAAGGELLSHDGGQHDHPSLLSGLVGRADRVVFPVDCVSHDAALAVKRLCRQLGKPWAPLRSSGLASFLTCMATSDGDAASAATVGPTSERCCPFSSPVDANAYRLAATGRVPPARS